MRFCKLVASDFATVLEDVSCGDFVYLDPPYYAPGRKIYGEYGYGAFNSSDVQRLLDVLEHIDKVGGTFVLSYADSAEVHLLGSKWNYARVSVRRNVSGFAGARRLTTEVLVSNKDLLGVI